MASCVRHATSVVDNGAAGDVRRALHCVHADMRSMQAELDVLVGSRPSLEELEPLAARLEQIQRALGRTVG